MTRAEDWAGIVQGFIDGARSSPESARTALEFMSELLRVGNLPENGRAYLADGLEAIAAGEDGQVAFRLKRGAGAPTNRNACIGILFSVERIRCRYESEGLNQIEARKRANIETADRFQVSVATVKNNAAEARKRYRALGIKDEEIAAMIK